jgi:hypothetical protein
MSLGYINWDSLKREEIEREGYNYGIIEIERVGIYEFGVSVIGIIA